MNWRRCDPWAIKSGLRFTCRKSENPSSSCTYSRRAISMNIQNQGDGTRRQVFGVCGATGDEENPRGHLLVMIGLVRYSFDLS
ncbi:hypothetical protein [Sulfuracidifex metallicus]|uniref:Uncharacterized protein n=1 Tax=Sulfuracidifex metallicus DSM 6482 = JCM 9184 TaxID=523847 RepID=A0A6A9QVI1_SULME|nr:hypothetical protein [Sulfuracidifex metallicus]MUN29773.1 hypothetical protein [Sulfuracidifex metallicus DSM 6482 = JCM 9184]WOE51846.1 hypothetical protein RQ359_001186 [Sulfuracidifex metallicus DSM 6482 = JCM 9184]